jgi:hypothetical protein
MNNQSLIDYWNAVDAALQEHFGTDTADAGIGIRRIADACEAGWAPEDFAFWCGVNYDLQMLSGG